MIKKWSIVSLVFVLLVFGFSLPSIAGCKSDCQSDYESAVESCKQQYDEPDDAQSLQACMDEAQNDYASCINECDS